MDKKGKNKIVYISGKIVDKKNRKINQEKIIRACHFYEKRGYDVINPNELQDIYFPVMQKNLSTKQMIGIELYFLSRADMLALLDDWKLSFSAPYEIALAIKFNMPIIKAFSFNKLQLEHELKVEEVNFGELYNSIDKELLPGGSKIKPLPGLGLN